MKHIFKLSGVLFVLICSSCNIENDDNFTNIVVTVNENNVMRATVNQMEFESFDINTRLVFESDTNVSIVAGNGTATIVLKIKNFSGTGLYPITNPDDDQGVTATYTINATENAGAIIYNAIIDETDLQDVLVNVSSDSNIEGSFSFNAENIPEDSTLEIIGGTFKILRD